MEIVELVKENIASNLDDCVALQLYLVKPDSVIFPEMFIESAEDSHTYFLGLCDDGKIVGMGVLSKMVHPVNITGYINNVVVHPDARGKGLFKVIMDSLESKAKEWGCTDVALTCSRAEVQAKYEERGYVKKETEFYIYKVS